MSDWDCYCDHCSGTVEPPPEPCEYCYVMTREMRECDGTCKDLTQERYNELTKETP